jgi:two-component system NtrC family sensor kinase
MQVEPDLRQAEKRHRHIVQFYKNESYLLGSLVEYIKTGLIKKEGVVAFASGQLQRGIIADLNAIGFQSNIIYEQVLFIDGKEASEALISEGVPDYDRFYLLVGTALDAMTSRCEKVRIFDGLVDLMALEERFDAARAVAGYWNDFLLKKPHVTLLSAYSKDFSHLPNRTDAEIISSDGVQMGRPEQIWKTIGMLEQRTVGLKLETRESAAEASIRLEQANVQTGKLAVLTQMSAGLIHELRNPLTIINLATHRLLSVVPSLTALPDDSRHVLLKDLKNIGMATTRMSSIMKDIDFISKEGRVEDEVFSIAKIIEEAIESVQQVGEAQDGLNPKDVQFQFHTDSQVQSLMVAGSSSKLVQVFVNLFNNAKDAILSRHPRIPGKITVRMQRVSEVDLEIVVSDNGPGMAPEVLKNIFTPFFTTKPVGHGSGMGLSIVMGIIKNHGGHLECRSQESMGTDFVIRFPVYRGESTT